MTSVVTAVVGAGSWGTAVAGMLGQKVPVRLWARRSALAAEVARTRVNSQYLPGFALPDSVTVTSSMGTAVRGADVVFLAVPSHGLRHTLAQMSGALPKQAILVSLIKGIELSTGLRMSQVMAGDFPDRKICAVSGPNLVDEVISGHPSATVVASPSFQAAHLVQELLTSTSMRVYTNPDLVGVELAGATKNIVAISAGMAVGLGFGDNTRASLITRGLAEMTRLGTALGGNPATFAGLAGLGDLVATCASPASRNRRLGQKIAAGLSLAEIEEATPTVAEGARTSRAVLGLAAQAGVRMPIAERVAAVLWEGMKPVEAVAQLMDGRAGSELDMVPSEESV